MQSEYVEIETFLKILINSKTHAAWSRFLNETPERYNVGSSQNPELVVNLPRPSSAPPARGGILESLDTVNSGIGADFAQRPTMALR